MQKHACYFECKILILAYYLISITQINIKKITMSGNLTIMGSKEILLVAENIAHEKGILLQEVIEAMEEGLKSAAKKKIWHTSRY